MEFRYNLILLFSICISFIHSESEETKPEVFRTKRYCGSHLAQALSTICRGNYNTIYKKQDIYQKKSYWDGQYMADMPRGHLAYPFQKRSEAASLMSNYRRRKRQLSRRGVYNECCEKSCSHEELSSYCGTEAENKRR